MSSVAPQGRPTPMSIQVWRQAHADGIVADITQTSRGVFHVEIYGVPGEKRIGTGHALESAKALASKLLKQIPHRCTWPCGVWEKTYPGTVPVTLDPS